MKARVDQSRQKLSRGGIFWMLPVQFTWNDRLSELEWINSGAVRNLTIRQ